MKEIIGHKKQIDNIKKPNNNGFPQSIIFSGNSGIGKYSLAKHFINWRLAKKLIILI